MYSVQSTSALARNLTARGLRKRVGTTVLLLGTCSLLTDSSWSALGIQTAVAIFAAALVAAMALAVRGLRITAATA
jgi:Na+-translocating ferredoxin:NAD+ oxidoreductase RnfE subunit